MSVSNSYRPDIDGLRALAVMAVVVYHAFPSALPGGFIGVDVFFVISGYLISGIIFAAVDEEDFSFIDFYARRARRIFPALAIVLAATLVVGWAILLPAEYAKLGQHVLGGVTFTSNFLLHGESGYFDESSSTKPLLHLWSLAIEEQFYLLFPVIVVIASRFKLHRIGVLAVVAFASFVTNIWVFQSDPATDFFSPQTRFWELLAGSILAAWQQASPSKRLASARSVGAFVGSGLIVTGLATLTAMSPFPGWAALLPVMGTLLIIQAGPVGPINGRILASGLMQNIGRISYPLYLWHWVLLTFLSIATNGTADFWQVFSAVLLSLALAWLTYSVVEKPLRFSGRLRPRAFAATAVLASIGALALVVSLAAGFPQRTGDVQQFAEYFENDAPDLQYMTTTGLYDYYRNDCNFYDMQRYRAGNATNTPVPSIATSCTAEVAGKRTLLLWGDSHVQQLYFGLIETLPPDWNVLIVASSGCPPRFEDSDSATDYCVRSNWTATQALRKLHPDVVLVGQGSDHEAATMQALASAVLGEGAGGVVMTGPVPRWNAALWRTVATKYWRSTPQRLTEELDPAPLNLDTTLKTSLQLPAHASYVSLIDILCNKDGCLTRVGEDRMRDISTWDVAHLTLPASVAVANAGLTDAVLSVGIK